MCSGFCGRLQTSSTTICIIHVLGIGISLSPYVSLGFLIEFFFLVNGATVAASRPHQPVPAVSSLGVVWTVIGFGVNYQQLPH